MLLVLPILAAAVLLAAALQTEPSVALETEPDTADVARALALLRSHDPRRAQPGQARAIHLGERDLDVLLGHAAARRLPAAARVQIERGAAVVHASVHLGPGLHPLPALAWFGRWVNVELRLVETGALPAVQSWRVGGLPLPAAWFPPALRQAIARAGLQAEAALAAEVVQRVRFTPDRLEIVYAWGDDGPARAISSLLAHGELERLRTYHARLAELSRQAGPSWQAPMVTLLAPMFELARQRSRAPGADAAAENRAALVVLTLFATGRSVPALMRARETWPPMRHLQLTLAGRDDFPLHFLVSAALAAESSGPLSRAIGLHKEVLDSRQGSGFSFNDMAANRAGTRFGELAVQQPAQLQAALARGVQESDLLPATADLPEFMPEAEFKRRYGGVGAPAYEALMAEIDRRVGALPLLR